MRWWTDEVVVEDGFAFYYEVTQPATEPIRTGHIDDWEPGEGASFELTGIETEAGEEATIGEVVKSWTVDDADDAMTHINAAIQRDIDGRE